MIRLEDDFVFDDEGLEIAFVFAELFLFAQGFFFA